MDSAVHTLSELFRQLGLPDTRADVSRFIAVHRPLPPEVTLSEAPFWRPEQARFLSEELQDDSDWAELIDTLDASLRHPGPHPGSPFPHSP